MCSFRYLSDFCFFSCLLFHFDKLKASFTSNLVRFPSAEEENFGFQFLLLLKWKKGCKTQKKKKKQVRKLIDNFDLK